MSTLELKDAVAAGAASTRGGAAGRLLAALRGLVRGSEFWLVAVAAVIGAVTGVFVSGLSWTAQLMHRLLFGISRVEHLSSAVLMPPWALFWPAVGGLILGITSIWVVKWRRRPAIDPIEANALHGGRMSVVDSAVVAGQTLVSNGFGASVGLEAAYTQGGAVLGSRLGLALRLRRAEVRVFVGCGAAAAISAAFGAPITGAFYAFELIIGTYSVATVAPVMAASLAAYLVGAAIGIAAAPLEVAARPPSDAFAYLVFMSLGLAAGFAGIAVMRGVTAVEQLFQKTRISPTFRPFLGGAILGALGLVTPQVLSSGHGALHGVLESDATLFAFASLFCLKMLASAVSLGAGFRGGLFFASLLLGALLGRIFASGIMAVAPHLAVDPVTAAVVGMSALAVAVVGGPLTMTFLALETSGDLLITGIVLAAATVSSITVREFFGYSFSTWRLHLRGETIRSAHDVGWIRSLTAGRMMRQDVKTVREDMPIAEFRNKFPIGSKHRVVALDAEDRYAGLVNVADAYAPEEESATKARRVCDLVQLRRDVLTPDMNVKDAIAAFDRTESEALVVVDDPKSRKVLGLLTEQHALRRYAEELDKVRQGLSGTI
ncbi:chloride channel protein [Enterovirga aerilata]|uniref:Chloride channel protein n=1 Tax=Enterovirga aerilata TaxID=2730920 RepID=A0A849IAJ0_9HYPH|nr:chloride channel protein [Enterovirga sp. DB1703]NNM73080.1 chloride channel protein [Enterovirga sp. DB1703]